MYKLLGVNGLNKKDMFSFHENQNSQSDQTVSQSAKLAVIAGAINTLGDALGTIASVLAIEEAQQEQNDNGNNKNMQKQLDYLTSEVEKIRKQMNSSRR